MDTQLNALEARQHHPEHLVQEMRSRAAQDRPPEPKPASHGPLVSAPVSRDVPSGYSGNSASRIRLTKDQADFAKLAGISETEYAAQLLRLNQLKVDGHYGEKR